VAPRYYLVALSAPFVGPNNKEADVAIRPSEVSSSRAIEKYYAVARKYGEEPGSCGDERLWELIETVRSSSMPKEAFSKLCRVVYKAGHNSMREVQRDMDANYGALQSICSRCGQRFKRHRHGGRCPGEYKNFVTLPIQPIARSD
jgi:hypothetical protein